MTNTNHRLEAFSDGVFAIALTLLIIEIKIPPVSTVHSSKELWLAFSHEWPSWLAFIVSFITILISWVNHTHLMHLIDKSNPKFTYSNGLLLFFIIIIPFPTAAVAEYLNTDFAQPASTIYCGACLLNNLAWYACQYTSLHPQSLYKSTVSLEKVNRTGKFVLFGTGLYLFTFMLSFWFPILAFSIVAVSYMFWIILGISIREDRMLAGKQESL